MVGGVKRASYELLGKAVELAEAAEASVAVIYGGVEGPEEFITRGRTRWFG